MLFSQVETFVEVARRGNLTRAADSLHMSQPAVTARLQSLEGELGEALFLRTHRGMDLTEAGKSFLPHASRALEALRIGAETIDQIRRGVAGDLVIGAAPAVSAHLLPRLLVRFTQAYPDVRLHVRTGHSEEVLAALIHGEVQVGLAREMHDDRIESRLLYEDELALVAHPGHPLAHDRTVTLAEVADSRLIQFDRTSSYYDLTKALFRSAGTTPKSVIELDNLDAAKQMVLHGLGAALLPATSVANELMAGTLRRVRVADAPSLRRRLVAFQLKQSHSSGPLLRFLALLEEEFPLHGGVST